MNEIVNTLNSNTKDKSDIKEKKLRPCCACPETRELRDKCIFEKGEENCYKYINDHKNCLKDLGFQV